MEIQHVCHSGLIRDALVTATGAWQGYPDRLERLPRQGSSQYHDNISVTKVLIEYEWLLKTQWNHKCVCVFGRHLLGRAQDWKPSRNKFHGPFAPTYNFAASVFFPLHLNNLLFVFDPCPSRILPVFFPDCSLLFVFDPWPSLILPVFFPPRTVVFFLYSIRGLPVFFPYSSLLGL